MVRFVLILLLGSGLCTAFAQSCLSDATLQQNPADTTIGGTDGLAHISYTFVDANGNAATPDASTLTSVNAAVGQWNGQSSTTGVEFDLAPAGQDPSVADIQFQLQSNETKTGGCAAYSPNTARVYYGPTFQQSTAGSTIIAHELGHALGLNDAGTNPNPPSIMNNPSNSLPYACTSPRVPTTSVQASDASAAWSCVARGRGQHDLALIRSGITYDTIPDSSFIYTSNPSCTYSYGEIDYYVDGQFDSFSLYISDIYCTV